jgi:two-component system cell cycle response regulator
MAIPDAILNKPGPLDAHEWQFIKRHTLIGEGILSASLALVPVAKIIRSSHEPYDGTATPIGSPARTSHSPHASSPSATRTTR